MATLQDQGNELPECPCPPPGLPVWLGGAALNHRSCRGPPLHLYANKHEQTPRGREAPPALRGLLGEHHDQLREDRCRSDG